jgi:hypothetical protein
VGTDIHCAKLARVPRLLAADAAFYSAKNEAKAKAMGVKRVCVPNRSTKSAEHKREQRKRWFRNGQKWRTGCEGRISVARRRHGLRRCRYKGSDGMQRIADNLINVGRALEAQRGDAPIDFASISDNRHSGRLHDFLGPFRWTPLFFTSVGKQDLPQHTSPRLYCYRSLACLQGYGPSGSRPVEWDRERC